MRAKSPRTGHVLVTLLWFGWHSFLGQPEKAQQVLFERFFKLRGVYVKYLQMLAVHEKSASIKLQGANSPFAVFDQVEYEPIDVSNLVKHELGDASARIQLRSKTPFAAGSFAQVYLATLDQRTQVVVKVLRPSAVRYLRSDLRLLGITARIMSWFMSQGMIDILTVFKDFKKITLQEVDYVREAATAKHVFEQYEGNSTVRIPKTYGELSTKFLIVQEYMSGLPLTDVLAANTQDKKAFIKEKIGSDIQVVMERLAYELLANSLKPGGTHGDPHPGNLFLLPNNQVALIDFGISSVMDEHRSEFRQLLSEYVKIYRGNPDMGTLSQAMLSYFVPDLIRSIKTLGAYYNKEDIIRGTLEEIGKSVSQTITERAGDPAVAQLIAQTRMLIVFTKVINRNNRLGVKTAIEAPAFLRSSQLFLNIIRQLDCDRILLANAYQKVLDEWDSDQPATFPNYDQESLDRSFHIVAGWLERMQYNDPNLYNRIAPRFEHAL